MLKAKTDSLEGLGELHRALDDGTEMLAALVSLAVSQEVPPIRLLEAAGDAVERLASWRAGILDLLKHCSGSDIQNANETLH